MTSPVVGLLSHEPATSAIKLMVEKKLTALAVFSDDGHLFTNISASDICMAIVHGFDLNQEMRSFVSQCRTKFIFTKRKGRDFPAAVTAHPESFVKNVVQKLAATGLHRLVFFMYIIITFYLLGLY
jgi:CBS-domain-containing membrane protein